MSAAISIVASVLFMVCAGIGFNFYVEGRLWLTVLVFVVVMCLGGYALWTMISSKRNHNAREGRPREFAALGVAIVLLGLGSVFFTKFLDITSHRDELHRVVRETVTSMAGIDSCYAAYAQTRLNALPPAERELLRQRIIPAGFDSIAHARHDWLASLHEAKVSNLYTATNVRHLREAQQRWTEDYANLSATILTMEGQDVQLFSHEESEDLLEDFTARFTAFNRPGAPALFFCLLCLGFILLWYLTTPRPRSHVNGRY